MTGWTYTHEIDDRPAGYIRTETFEKCQILFKLKKGDNFNYPREMGFTFHGGSTNILACMIVFLVLYLIRQMKGLFSFCHKVDFCEEISIYLKSKLLLSFIDLIKSKGGNI